MRKPMAVGRIYRTPEGAIEALHSNGFKPLSRSTWKLVFEHRIFTAQVSLVGPKFRTQVIVHVG